MTFVFKNRFKIFTAVIAVGILALTFSMASAQTPAPSQGTSQATIISTSQRCAQFKQQFSINGPNGSVNIIGNLPVYCSATSLLILVINYLLAISATVTILFLMVGGFWYVTAAGNEEQSEKGRKIITNAVIGLVVIVMSYAIVRIVNSTLSLGK